MTRGNIWHLGSGRVYLAPLISQPYIGQYKNIYSSIKVKIFIMEAICARHNAHDIIFIVYRCMLLFTSMHDKSYFQLPNIQFLIHI